MLRHWRDTIGSKKEGPPPHQPVEQQHSLPQDEDEQGVSALRQMCVLT